MFVHGKGYTNYIDIDDFEVQDESWKSEWLDILKREEGVFHEEGKTIIKLDKVS